MKKIIVILLTFMLFSITGCTTKTNETEQTNQEETQNDTEKKRNTK